MEVVFRLNFPENFGEKGWRLKKILIVRNTHKIPEMDFEPVGQPVAPKFPVRNSLKRLSHFAAFVFFRILQHIKTHDIKSSKTLTCQRRAPFLLLKERAVFIIDL